MDVILKVLAGAKAGTKIAIKKDEFLIGRSQQCHLCAGSSSVSRQHCAIKRQNAKVTIQDLGSRNGTVVNGEKIAAQVELSSGDEIGIGTLKLLVTITHGINNLKRPKVKTVAEAVDRTANSGDSNVGEEDITQWLLDAPSPSPSSIAASETQTIRMDDTNAAHFKAVAQKPEASSADVTDAPSQVGHSTDEPSEEASSGDDSSVKKEGPKSKKRAPGKLPKISSEPDSKDSREAAMNALRNWNRRR